MERKIISVLERGFQVLSALNEPGVTEVRHIHQATALPKPTIVRLLDSLIAQGFVVRRPGGGYALTARVLGLSRGYRSADAGQLLQAAAPILRWLRQQTSGWPSDLAICDAETMIVVDPGPGAGSQFLNRNRGYRLSITGSALGRAYLAFCPDDERQEVLQRVARQGPAAPAGPTPSPPDARALGPLLATIRRKGFASRDCERGKTTRVVAAPILVSGRPIASLSVVAAARAMTLEQMERSFAAPLTQAAATIARAYSRESSHSR